MEGEKNKQKPKVLAPRLWLMHAKAAVNHLPAILFDQGPPIGLKTPGRTLQRTQAEEATSRSHLENVTHARRHARNCIEDVRRPRGCANYIIHLAWQFNER